MATETEYRFLLASLPDMGGIEPMPITQGYLSTDPEKTVRIRRMGDSAWLTIKGPKSGAQGLEFEYEIPVTDAVQLLGMCGAANTLDKDRYEIAGPDGHVWEVDRFKGRHDGLVIAEIELPSLKTAFQKPAWMTGVDITQDFRFANAMLTQTSPADLQTNIAVVLQLR